MASPTTNLALTYPAHGGAVNAWDTPLNADFEALDAVTGGTQGLAAAGAGVTLTQTQANNRRINVTGVLGQNYLITFPAIGGLWVVNNATTGAFTVTCKVTGSGATPVTIPQGKSLLISSNAVDMFVGLNAIDGVFSVTGNFDVNTNKFTVNATTGDALIAGQLSQFGDIIVNTNKAAIYAANGNILTIGDISGATVAGSMLASQAEQEAGTAVNKLVTPGRQQYHPSAAKSWCKWGVTSTIDASFNVASITDTGAGNWTVNFTTAFSTVDYSVVGTCAYNSVNSTLIITLGTQAVGSIQVFSYNHAGGIADSVKNYIACFGDQ